MSEIKKICESIVKYKNYSAKSTKKRILYMKCLNVEDQMFKLYLKSGKSSLNTFPFENLGKVLYMNQSEVVKIAKLLFEVGWNPRIHVILTREKFKSITYIGKSVTF